MTVIWNEIYSNTMTNSSTDIAVFRAELATLVLLVAWCSNIYALIWLFLFYLIIIWLFILYVWTKIWLFLLYLISLEIFPLSWDFSCPTLEKFKKSCWNPWLNITFKQVMKCLLAPQTSGLLQAGAANRFPSTIDEISYRSLMHGNFSSEWAAMTKWLLDPTTYLARKTGITLSE